MKKSIIYNVIICSALISMPAAAANLEVKTTEQKPDTVVNHGEDLASVHRVEESGNTLNDSFTRPSRPCPPFCVNPLDIEDDVATVAELDVIKFIETALHSGRGVLVDARSPSWYDKGTIPGSTNIPFTEFEKPATDPQLVALLEQLGGQKRDEVNMVMRSLEKVGFFDGRNKTDDWDFSRAKQLIIWCNGSWCGQSPRAIRALISLGYPADKIYFYRGGLQMWQSLGLSTVIPADLSTFASK